MANNRWLQGKRVLVTRPAAQAEGLVSAIEAQGGIAVTLPVIGIEALAENAERKQKVINLDHYDEIILTSPNAVQLGLEAIDPYWPQLPPHLRWFAVGKATACLLEQHGIKALAPASGFNSEALLALPDLAQPAGHRVAIIKGEGGRELMAETLRQRGAQVDSLYFYRRCPISYSQAELAQRLAVAPDALTATSVDILCALDELLGECLPARAELPLVVASERIAEAAKAMGYQQIFTADSASDQSIVATLNVIG
ncbi:MAG: uroporphyrinogen-III synthase [Pseudomonadales bacterium]|jgi:uroporphyrinogen-III synthase